MSRLIIPSIASLALLGSVSLAAAQGHQHGPGGGGGGGMRGGGGAMHAPGGGGGGMRSGPSGGGRAYQAPRQASPRAYHQHSRQVERPVHRSERSRNAESRRAAPDRQRAQRDLNRNRQVERNAERNRLKTGQKAVEGRGGREASERGLEQRVAERHSEIQQARTKLGAQDRERMHKAFNFDRARVTRVNFDHRIGHRVPRNFRLFAIPAAVIAFFPYYRDYSYFVVDDDVCIVDRNSYAIVDVIDQGYWSGGGGRQQVAGLRLSASEISLVRDSIPRDFPVADVRLRLALGAEIPGDIQLHDFAVVVLDRVPQLREFRFLLTEDQIVIVDPHDRSIALVIDRT